MGAVRKMGAAAVEDRGGEKTLIGYDEDNDEIGHISVSSITGAIKINNEYFKDVRYDYDVNDNCIYKGQHLILDSATSNLFWYIIRYDYTDGNCTRKRFRITSWDDRALGW